MAQLSETAASLRVLGDDLEPSEITNLLGKQPERAERKGDEISLPNRGIRVARTGAWTISVNRKRPGDLDSQISEILYGLTDDLSTWLQITSRFKVEIFCGLFLENFNEGLAISAATTKLLGLRNISLDLDIYNSDKG